MDPALPLSIIQDFTGLENIRMFSPLNSLFAQKWKPQGMNAGKLTCLLPFPSVFQRLQSCFLLPTQVKQRFLLVKQTFSENLLHVHLKTKERKIRSSQTITYEGIRKKIESNNEALLTLNAENLRVRKINKYWDSPGRLPRGRKLGLTFLQR